MTDEQPTRQLTGEELLAISAIHVSRDPEEYFEIWNDGFDDGWSQAWGARLLTSPAAVLAAAILVIGLLIGFAVGQAAAAPRSAQVNPSDPGTTATTTPELSGAPPSPTWSPADEPDTRKAAPPFDPSSFPPIGYGAPNPATGHDAGEYCSEPPDCGYAAPSPRPAVSRGTAGEASWWYSFGPGLYAAIRPDLGHKGDQAVVCGGSPFHCLTLPIITTCACLGPNSDRLIDISRDAFVDFAPPGFWPGTTKPREPGWQGTIRITLQVLER